MQIEQKNQYRNLCLSCLKAKKACLCQFTPNLQTSNQYIILMHPKKAKKQKVGTGRMTHLALQNSKIRVGVDFSKDHLLNSILDNPKYAPYLLYPGNNSHNIDLSPLPTIEDKKRTNVFIIIDGTWPCAKTMMRLSTNLHSLPRVSFNNTKESLFNIKQQPFAGCLSTIESVAALISKLNKWGQEKCHQSEELLLLLNRLVDFQRKCAADPSLKRYRKGKYKDPSERNYPKRFETRKAWFAG